jgi:methionyl-tRNA formyltransferase
MIKTLFMGRKQVAASCLEWLSSHPSYEVVGVLTDSHLSGSVTAESARKLDIPLLDYDSAMILAASGNLDLGLSVLYWRKLKGSLLFLDSDYGCINFHPALLPEYKGCAGYNMAILDRLARWGTSCHYVDGGIDTGLIIEVSEFPVDVECETAQSLEIKTLQAMQLQFYRVMGEIASCSPGRLPTTSNSGGRYISRQGMEALKQVCPGDDPELKARAFYFPPYDGAWVNVNGKKMTLLPTCVLRSMGDPRASSLFSQPVKYNGKI